MMTRKRCCFSRFSSLFIVLIYTSTNNYVWGAPERIVSIKTIFSNKEGVSTATTPWWRTRFSSTSFSLDQLFERARSRRAEGEKLKHKEKKEDENEPHDSRTGSGDVLPRGRDTKGGDEESWCRDDGELTPQAASAERRSIQTDVIGTPSLLTIVSSLRSAIQQIFRHPRFLGRCVQTGLAIYIIQAMWTAASELVDELQAEYYQKKSQAYLQRDVVSQILQELTAPSPEQKSILAQEPVLAHLSKTLLASGMSLRASTESGHKSIEQILLSLTKADVSLLQQSLWTPPTSPSARHDNDWDGICGLQPVKESLIQMLWTWKQRDHGPYAHLVEKPPGLLLYGPPGCGKTVLVRAIASETQLPCLIVTPSLLLRKYVGDSNLQVRTLFQLAEKLSPCIICLDELDGLFRERSSTEHDVSRDLKTEFLQFWDGMSSSDDSRVLVVGATNRPFDVDPAVLRRMPQSYFVGLPHEEARLEILQHLTKGIPLSPDFALAPLASKTEGYTPSDLKQIVRTAVTVGPLREARMTQLHRSLTTEDVLHAKSLVAPTPLSPGYRAALVEYARNQAIPGNSMSFHHHGWENYFDAGTVHATFDHSVAREWSDEDSGTEEDTSDDLQLRESDDEDL